METYNQEVIIFFVWLCIELIVIAAIIYDYVKYSDSRNDFDQQECQTWYGLFIMAWPIMAVFAIFIGTQFILGWLCMQPLKFIKYIVNR